MLKGEFEFILSDKIEYAVGGDTKTATNITVRGPSYNDTKNVLKLHSLINQAIIEMRNKISAKDIKQTQEDDKEQKLKPEDIVGILSSGYCDTDKIFDIFNELLLKSGKLDGKINLDPMFLSKLTPMSALKLLGEYVINFPIAV